LVAAAATTSGLLLSNHAEMRVSPERIYQSLCIQSRGLRRDLTKCLRTEGALRTLPRGHKRRNEITERPAEADDRAVPGRFEGLS
jgi:IS30 family transposase